MIHISTLILSLFFFSHHEIHASEQRKHATVRIGSELSTHEQEWIATRKCSVKNTLEQLLALKLADDEVPTIALCLSGGGYRAMIATLGLLQGACTPPKTRSAITNVAHIIAAWFYHTPAPLPLHLPIHTTCEQAGEPTTAPTIFDTVSYCTSLSGSTWTLSSWLYSHMSLDAYCARLATNIEKSLLENIDFTALSNTLAHKHAYHQPLSLVDTYGSLLAQKLLYGFGTNPYDTVLTKQQEYAGSMPFLIYSTVIGESAPQYQWAECTPYEIGSTYLNAWIPTWAFNRTFTNGISTNNAPEQPLSFLLGVWGSAMCMTAQEFVELIKPHVQQEIINLEHDEQAFVHGLESTITSLVHIPTTIPPHTKNIFTTQRLSPARVYNWTFKSPDLPLHTHETITLVDAGIDFRIPTPPLLQKERHVDIIIVMDASDRPLSTELHLAQAYAQQYQLPFPAINYQIASHPFSVHGVGNTHGAPIIIYMPLVQNPKYHNGWDPRAAAFTSTYNFKYTKEQTYLLAGLTKYTMIEHHQDILGVIKEWITKKRYSSNPYKCVTSSEVK
ncbi:MAG: hypothetical protein ACHQVS_00265 [Candidatus Babeliales bacterium]